MITALIFFLFLFFMAKELLTFWYMVQILVLTAIAAVGYGFFAYLLFHRE